MSRLPFILLLFVTGSSQAAICNVPASYTSVQAAVNDNNCSEIQMSPGQYEGSVNISRSLSLSGSGSNRTVIRGVVSVSGNATQVTLTSFRISGGCLGSWLISSGGARVSASVVTSEYVAPTSCGGGELIFEDGFESNP
jgi:nitrous oxidase accessory protein NosD